MNLDTVACSLPILEKNIKDWTRFRRAGNMSYLSDSEIRSFQWRSYAKLVLCLSPEQQKSGLHYPTVTLEKKKIWWSVHVEGSFSRFYFGSNLFELVSPDYEPFVTKLYDFLHDNGLLVERSDIYEATMHKADISKILLLHPDIPIRKMLDNISKVDFDMRNETHFKEYTDFREGGKGLCVTWGTTKKKLASLYDKLTELRHHPNKTSVEKSVIIFLEENKSYLYQVLKYEESLHDKTRLNYVCNKITGQERKNYTFTDFWEKDLIKKILLFRGERLFAGKDIKILLLGNHTPSQIQQELKQHAPEIRAGKLSSIAHWTALANELGIKEMKKQLQADFSRSTQNRILQETRFLLATMTKLPMQEVFDDLHTQLQELKPIRSMKDLLLPPLNHLYTEFTQDV